MSSPLCSICLISKSLNLIDCRGDMKGKVSFLFFKNLHFRIYKEAEAEIYEFIFVACLKRDKVVNIYSKFWFDYHLGKRSDTENAHSPLKMTRFSTPLWHFQTDSRCILLVSYCNNTKRCSV